MAGYKGFSSRRQYRNAVARSLGWSSESQRQRFVTLERTDPEAAARFLGYEPRDGNSAATNRAMYQAGAQRSRDLRGFRPWSQAAARRGYSLPVFEKAFNAARKSNWSRDPKGPFAQLLTMIGYRDPDSEKDVGDS